MNRAPLLLVPTLILFVISLFCIQCSKTQVKESDTVFKGSTETLNYDDYIIFSANNHPPFCYLKNGEAAGPTVDIIKKVCQAANIGYQIQVMPILVLQREITTGEANAVFVVTPSPERSRYLDYSLPLFASEKGFFLNKKQGHTYGSPRDIAGWIIGTVGLPDSGVDLETEFKDKILIDWNESHDEAFYKLNARVIDAVYANKELGLTILEKNSFNDLYYAGAYKQVTYHIGFARAFIDKELVDKFNYNYKKLYQEGVIARILAPYGMKPAEIE